MAERESSHTARGVAMLRAAHQILDAEPLILRDPVIARLLGTDTERTIRAHAERFQSPALRALRSHVVLRSRVAEDRLEASLARGVVRYVVLGAGLDTFAYRQPEWARSLAIVEVDHPATQAAKREALRAAAIEIPANVRYAGIDFEEESLSQGLRRCGVASDQPTFFSWLGVTMYLTRPAIEAVLATVASFPRGSELVLTFARPPAADDVGALAFAEGAARLGEPWISYFTPEDLEALLSASGFSDVWVLGREEAVARFYTDRRDALVPPRRVSIASAVV
jgi:methyltransferase (TIGR00027 family)